MIEVMTTQKSKDWVKAQVPEATVQAWEELLEKYNQDKTKALTRVLDWITSATDTVQRMIMVKHTPEEYTELFQRAAQEAQAALGKTITTPKR